MEVEVEGEDGSKFVLGEAESGNGKALFGRGCGFNTNDRTVSRRHVSFQLNKTGTESEPRVSFEVIGRNPIWVCTKKDPAVRLLRKFDTGELEFGDRFCFCLSGTGKPVAPFWFVLNLKGSPLQEGNKSENESSRGELPFEFEDMDPVKEFGFIVMGHEFDHYPKGTIRNVKNWEWFLEEPRKVCEDEEEFGKERREMRRKRKKGEDNEGDQWTGESEDDKVLVAKIGKGKRPGYSTRSKDSKGPNRDTKGSRNSKRKKTAIVNETVEDEEDDETLGGFIVDDEEEDQEEENNEDEEQEFEEDDDDDDGVED